MFVSQTQATHQINAVGGIKIFDMDNTVWVAAATREQAITFFVSTLKTPADDVEHLNPTELTPAQLDSETYFMAGRGGPATTFRAELERRVKSKNTFPQFFATADL